MLDGMSHIVTRPIRGFRQPFKEVISVLITNYSDDRNSHCASMTD